LFKFCDYIIDRWTQDKKHRAENSCRFDIADDNRYTVLTARLERLFRSLDDGDQENSNQGGQQVWDVGH
jgi:hypothetical protein